MSAVNKIRHLISNMLPSKHLWPRKLLASKAMKYYTLLSGLPAFDYKNPRLFTEKVIWYKIFYSHPDLGRIVDKYDFKNYVSEKLGQGYTAQCYGVYNSINDLVQAWPSLPHTFVLKSTVKSDGNFIKVVKNKDSINLEHLTNEVKDWFVLKNTLINSYCSAYYGCKPRVIAEEYIAQIDDDQLYDYKIFCFNGKPYCFYIALDHFKEELYPITFYDLQWNKMDVTYGEHKTCDVPKPKNLERMISIAEKLSQGFPFMRVDFFDTGERLFLAEMTLYPGGGQTPYHPHSFNEKLGDMFVLPKD